MKIAAFVAPVLVTMMFGSAQTARAAGPEDLAVPGFKVARDVADAKELPDPKLDYKIAWGVGQGAKDKTAEVNPALPTIAQYVNTLAKWGVPKEKRHIIVMFHQRNDDFDIVLSNEAFKAKYGKDNPNVPVIAALKKAGVEFRACGQAVAGRKIAAKDMNPDIQVDLWAMTTFFNLQMKGFVRAGN